MKTSPRVTRPDDKNESRQTAKSLEEAFSRHQDELLGMLFHMIGSIEDAKDALQDAFIRCWKRRDDLAEIENLPAWIFCVTLNIGRDLRGTAWRRRRRPLEEEGSPLTAIELGPEVEASRSEQLAIIRQAIQQLRTEEQEVFLLRQDGQMTYEQIAKHIDIPVGTVKTRMRLALKKLREAIESE